MLLSKILQPESNKTRIVACLLYTVVFTKYYLVTRAYNRAANVCIYHCRGQLVTGMQSQKCRGRSSLPSRRPQAQLNQLYQALSDINADRIVLLVCMGLKRETIRQFEIQNCRHEDRTFMDCLHYFLNNLAKPGEEWEQVVKALQVSKDPHTANEIQRTYSKCQQLA